MTPNVTDGGMHASGQVRRGINMSATAFGIEEEDVERVLRQAGSSYASLDRPIAEIVTDILPRLDRDRIGREALKGGVGLDEQAEAADAEIRRQLVHIGVMRLAKTLYQELGDAGVELSKGSGSDLHFPVTPSSQAIVARRQALGSDGGVLVSKFISNIDGRPFFERAFGYDPFWEEAMEKDPAEESLVRLLSQRVSISRESAREMVASPELIEKPVFDALLTLSVELSRQFAEGRDESVQFYDRIQLVEAVMQAAPWSVDPDDGVVPKAAPGAGLEP